MKIYLTIILCVLLISCSKKTHVLSKTQTSSHLQEAKDSIGKKNLLSRDKSIIITNSDLDTTITINSKSLSGSFNFNDSVKHFENDDLTIDFKKDKSGSNITFKAFPKVKKINARYHQQIIKQNDITQTEDSQLIIKTKVKSQLDSVYNHVVDHQDPAVAVNNIKTAVIWIIFLLILATTGFCMLKKRLFE